MNENINSAPPDEIQNKQIPLKNGFQIGELSLALAIYIPITFVFLALLEGISWLWRPAAVVLYLILMVFSLLVLFGFRVYKDLPKIGREEIIIAETIIFLILVLVCFSQVCRHLYVLAGGFLANQAGYWHWLRFGVANFLEAILLDIPDIYQWNVTEIEATTFWSRSILFVFRTGLEIIVIKQIINAFQFAKQTWISPDKEQHNSYWGYIFTNLGNLLLVAFWAIPMSIGIGAIVNDSLSFQATLDTFSLGIPVAFGCWFAWTNLKALFVVSGGWKKLLALTGLVFSIWLVIIKWNPFIMYIGPG